MTAGKPTSACFPHSQWRGLALWTVASHVAAFGGVVFELVATGLPLLIVLALTFAVVAAGSAVLSWMLSHKSNRSSAADLFFYGYGMGALLFASAAGATIAVLALVAPPQMPPQVTTLAIPALVALAMIDLYQALEAARARTQQQAHHFASDPVRATLIVMLLVSAFAATAAAVALVLAREFAMADILQVACLAIVLALALVAAHFGLEVRQRLVGVAASSSVRRNLLVALDKAAMQTGAIREISELDAYYLGPADLRVVLHIDFKDGVSAQHIGPVLEKLRVAAVEVADVSEVLLAPPRA